MKRNLGTYLIFIPIDKVFPKEDFLRDVKKQLSIIHDIQPIRTANEVIEKITGYEGLIVIGGQGSRELCKELSDNQFNFNEHKIFQYSNEYVVGTK